MSHSSALTMIHTASFAPPGKRNGGRSEIAEYASRSVRRMSVSRSYKPLRIEPSVCLAIISQAIDIPVPDQRCIGGINPRPATDDDHAVLVFVDHILRPHRRANLDDRAVLEGKSRNRRIGAWADQQHMAARQLEEARDIGDIFRLAIAFPGQMPVEAELAALPNGANDTNIGHGSSSKDRKSTRLNSSHANISYAVFCLKKKSVSAQPLNSSRIN